MSSCSIVSSSSVLSDNTAVVETTLCRPSIERQKEMYVDSLSPKEKRAYLIAKDHLGMSFTLEKSVGFLEWKKTQGF
jgi:hypothetical protein